MADYKWKVDMPGHLWEWSNTLSHHFLKVIFVSGFCKISRLGEQSQY